MSIRRFPWWPYWVALALILIVSLAPVASVMLAENLATANGCRVDEGSVHPCLINGKDEGVLLYNLGMMGWFMLLSLPAGLTAVLVWLMILFVHRSTWKRRQS